MTASPSDQELTGPDMEALLRLAQGVLDGGRPALLVDGRGCVVAANLDARRSFALSRGDRLPDVASRAVARLATALRAARAPRLERLRLPGSLVPTTFAASLIVSGQTRAVLLVTPADAVRPVRAAAPAAADKNTADPDHAAQNREIPDEPEIPAARPDRFLWRTDRDGRLLSADPVLAAVLGQDGASLRGRDWASFGAEAVDRAVRAGASFARLPAQLATAEGGSVTVEIGATPDRAGGMRGFGLIHRPARPQDERTARPPAAPASPAGRVDAPSPSPPPRPALSLVPVAPMAVASRVAETAAANQDEPGRSGRAPPSWAGLTAGERNAFREIARALGARIGGPRDNAEHDGASPAETSLGRNGHVPPEPSPEAVASSQPEPAAPEPPPEQHPGTATLPASEPVPQPEPVSVPGRPPAATPPQVVPEALRPALAAQERPLLDRLPLGIAVHRSGELLHANRTALDWAGAANLEALTRSRMLDGLLAGSAASPDGEPAEDIRALTLAPAEAEAFAVEARTVTTPWDDGTALLSVLRRTGSGVDERVRQAELALREAEATARELRAILDTATDGVVLIDAAGTILSLNHPAEALFGYAAGELQGESFTLLFAPGSRRAAIDYLDGLASNGVASVLNDGREVIGRAREGGPIPLFMTVGRVGDEAGKFCAVLRDITQWKRAEDELTQAKRLAEQANLAKSEFLAKISHEIRTPLNAIIGFSEVMMEERFGPIENERYRDYLRDIHASGGHLISLINDLLDLSKIEAGKLDLAFTSVALNEVVQQCMGIMQPQANRERIIIRSALAPDLPPVVADTRSIRQIVLNLVSNSIKFTRPGGQVILSTALTEAGEVVLRVRDTGIGMSETDIATAMEPFRQIATSGRAGSGGTGLGLPLTKALAEANRASFLIRSALDAGTLVEITFPSTRVLAE